MTSVGPIIRETPGAVRKRTRDEAPAAEAASSDGRALVPVSPPPPAAEDERRPMRRNSASFLAQLIANERQLPQTRERRRAEPNEALAAYSAAARLTRFR
jgi:hypothetical protein